MNNIITRLAPSPTGRFCHLGNCRTLLYNYFLAKKHGGKFLVRLEDTDRDRYTPEFLDYFKDMCDWLGIVPDGSYWDSTNATLAGNTGSFVQSERDYLANIKFLIDNGYAYYAFDTKEDLDLAHKTIPNFKYDATTRMSMKNSLSLPADALKLAKDKGNYVIRFAVTPNIDITFNDAILGDITINTNTLDDKVLLKSNGIGSYHLCNVCDDHEMNVSHVLRGQEWINSTPFHVLLYKAFGWDIPTFAHLPLIMNPDGKGKLSKRTAHKYGIPIAPLGYTDDDGIYQAGWKDLGYDPHSFINALSLIGWNPGGDVEVMSMDQLISSFSLDRVHKSGARFDMDKAKWINSHYVKNTSNADLLPLIKLRDNRYSDDKIDKIINLAKDRVDFKKDLSKSIDELFFTSPIIKDTKSFDENYMTVMSKFVDTLTLDSLNDVDNIKNTISTICTDSNIKMGKVMPGLRAALVGIPGPDLMTMMSILGVKETILRITASFAAKHKDLITNI